MMFSISYPSRKPGAKEQSPLVLSYFSSVMRRRQYMCYLFMLQHEKGGGIEAHRNRHCTLYVGKGPDDCQSVVAEHKPEVVITDSRFDWETPWSKDGITSVIRQLRAQGYPGRIFGLGMYATELKEAVEAGADAFMEEDEAFRFDVNDSRWNVCEGIRTLLERPPYRYFPPFPPEE